MRRSVVTIIGKRIIAAVVGIVIAGSSRDLWSVSPKSSDTSSVSQLADCKPADNDSDAVLRIKLSAAMQLNIAYDQAADESKERAGELSARRPTLVSFQPRVAEIDKYVSEIRQTLPRLKVALSGNDAVSAAQEPTFAARKAFLKLDEALNSALKESDSSYFGSNWWIKTYPKLSQLEIRLQMIIIDNYTSLVGNPVFRKDLKTEVEEALPEAGGLSSASLVSASFVERDRLLKELDEESASIQWSDEKRGTAAAEAKRDIARINELLRSREPKEPSSFKEKIQSFVEKNWQWLWATILVPISLRVWTVYKRKTSATRPKRRRSKNTGMTGSARE